MRKILMAMAVVLLSAAVCTSCKKTGNDPEPEPEPEPQFAQVVDSTFTSTGIVYNIQMISTNSKRNITFDIPSSAYEYFADQATQKEQAGFTLAKFIRSGDIQIQGGADKAACTADPYGHWFDANSKVCNSDGDSVYCGLIHNPDTTTGHSPITLMNVPGANKVGDKFVCRQYLSSTALGTIVPIVFTIEVVDSIK